MLQQKSIWISSDSCVSIGLSACQPQQAEPEKKPETQKNATS